MAENAIEQVVRLLELVGTGQPSGNNKPNDSPFVGQFVLVRTKSAGVHFGTLISRDGTVAVLRDACRLWRWSGAFTLSAVATSGPLHEGSRRSVPVPLIELTESIEIIGVSATAKEVLSGLSVD